MISLNLIKKYNLRPPFFVYDSRIIKRQFLKLKKSLPKNFRIFYSVKANPNIHILKIFEKLGAGAEISSGGELLTVLKAGFFPSRIIFTSPGKNNEELKLAVKKRIYLIIAESINEIERIEKIAQELNVKQNLLLRINPSFFAQPPLHPALLMAGGRQKFGIDEERVPQIISRLRNFKSINLLGLHLFSASNISDEKLVIRNTEHLFKVTRTLELKFKLYFPIIDIGGGIAVNYSTRPNKMPNLKNLSRGLRVLVDKYGFENRETFWESGRFLVAEAGEYIAQVVDKKESRGEIFVIIDGGKSHIAPAAGLLEKNHPVEVLDKRGSTQTEVVNIVGNLNTSYDFITQASLSKIEIGDLISIKNTGAYGFSAGMIFFSGHPLPGEYLLLKKDGLKIIRKKDIKYQ